MVEDALEDLARSTFAMADEAYEVAFRQLFNKAVEIVNVGRPRSNAELLRRSRRRIAMIECIRFDESVRPQSEHGPFLSSRRYWPIVTRWSDDMLHQLLTPVRCAGALEGALLMGSKFFRGH